MKFKSNIGGWVLIGMGIAFFLKNFYEININWEYIWPLMFVGLGLSMILKKK